ncbi:MAG: carboxypeptidase-like regulatory domain-containing protein [Chloroflexota bacterium]
MSCNRTLAGIFILILIAGIAGFGLKPAPTRAQERPTGDGIIQGQIINGTTDEPAAEITVTMSAFSGGTFVTDSRRTTDSDGRFQFEDLVTDEGITYSIEASYEGIGFGSGQLSFEDESDETLEVELTVYEPTRDPSVISIQERAFILSGINPEEGGINVLDVIVLELEGDQAFVANDDGRSVEFPVPRNAAQITPFPGADFDFGNASIEGATVYASSPLLPGQSTATLGYTIPYTGQRLPVELQAAYDADELRILIPDQVNDVTVAGGSLTPQGEETIGSQNYRLWTLENFSAGTRLNIAYENLPQSAVQPNTLSKLEPTIVSIIAILGATGVIAVIVTKRGLLSQPQSLAHEPEFHADPNDRATLVEQLRALEAAHEQGAIDPAEYRRYRRVILEQLRHISHQQRNPDDQAQAM